MNVPGVDEVTDPSGEIRTNFSDFVNPVLRGSSARRCERQPVASPALGSKG